MELEKIVAISDKEDMFKQLIDLGSRELITPKHPLFSYFTSNLVAPYQSDDIAINIKWDSLLKNYLHHTWTLIYTDYPFDWTVNNQMFQLISFKEQIYPLKNHLIQKLSLLDTMSEEIIEVSIYYLIETIPKRVMTKLNKPPMALYLNYLTYNCQRKTKDGQIISLDLMNNEYMHKIDTLLTKNNLIFCHHLNFYQNMHFEQKLRVVKNEKNYINIWKQENSIESLGSYETLLSPPKIAEANDTMRVEYAADLKDKENSLKHEDDEIVITQDNFITNDKSFEPLTSDTTSTNTQIIIENEIISISSDNIPSEDISFDIQ